MQIILAKGRGLLRTSSGLTIPHPSSLHHWDYLQHTIPLILWQPEILSELRDITAPLTLVRVLVFSALVNISPVQAPRRPPPTPAIPPPGQELPSEVWAPSSLPPSPGPASTTRRSPARPTPPTRPTPGSTPASRRRRRPRGEPRRGERRRRERGDTGRRCGTVRREPAGRDSLPT